MGKTKCVCVCALSFFSVHTYKKFVTRTMSVVGRIEGTGSHWWHMAKIKRQ